MPGVFGQEIRRPLARRFALTFLVVAAALFALYTFPYAENGVSERWFAAYLSGYARLAGAVLSIVEPGIRVEGPIIMGRFNMEIVKNCDAMEVNILFLAAVVAFPVSAKTKWIGVSLGLPFLVSLNVLRICCLYFVGALLPAAYEPFHLEVWPLLLIGSATGLFFAWTSWARRIPQTPEATSP